MIFSADSSATCEADGEKKEMCTRSKTEINCGRWNELSRAVPEIRGLQGHLEEELHSA